MHKITTGILDDEKNNREYIALLIEKNFPELEILFKVRTLEELFTQIKLKEPDILFLDIELENGLVFSHNLIQKLNCLKIYVTAHQQYAIEAIKTLAFDYLLKPINHHEFIYSTGKAIQTIKDKNQSTNPQENALTSSLLHTLDLPTHNGYKRIGFEDIIWCKADSSYTYVYLVNQPPILVSKPLASFDELLSDKNFFRIHNKYLINLLHYREYIKGKGGQVVLSDGTVLDVSVRKRPEFLQFLQRV